MGNNSGELGFMPPHPGEILRVDILPTLGMSAAQLADHIDVSRQTISNLLNEKRGVSTVMAIRLGKAFKNGARFWLALQMQHDLWVEENRTGIVVRPLEWNDGATA